MYVFLIKITKSLEMLLIKKLILGKKQSRYWKERSPSHRKSPEVVAKKNSLLMLLKLNQTIQRVNHLA